MGHIFFLMGKSASGKDTIYKMLISSEKYLEKIVPYTTRPIREGEVEGDQYHFCDIDRLKKLEEEGSIIEHRVYATCHGDWHYFTVNDESIDTDNKDYLVIGTLESYLSFREYFGQEKLVPLYVYVDDGIRLTRALEREKLEATPKYAEMCRRFLADSEDFSEENLKKADITDYYDNDNLEDCLTKLRNKIWTLRSTR